MSETSIQPAPVLSNVVIFKSGNQSEFRGPLISLSRTTATFEIQSPALTLKAADALSEFNILADGVSIYKGPAVVRQSVGSGSVGVCSVELSPSSFEQAYLESCAGPDDLERHWEGFLARWGAVYRVREEFKVALADIHTFLFDLRLFLERFEVGLQAMPAPGMADQEKRILDCVTPGVNRALDQLFERFEAIVAGLDEHERPSHRDYAQRLLHSLVLWAPFSDRSYRKPLGYAGDAEMVAMMFREHREGASLFGKVFNVWLLHQDSSLAHRNRVRLLEERLVYHLSDAARRGQPGRVLNVGCGPALEVQNLLAHSSLSDSLDIMLLDFNDATIAQTGAALTTVRDRYMRKTRLETSVKSVQQLLKEASARSRQPSYDFIYCAGLFDYLPDRICQRLMTLFYELVKPGGAVLATNVTPNNPNRGSMEFALEWYLIYRDAQGMLAIVPEGVTADQCHIFTDGTGTNIFLEVRRPDAT